MSSDSKIEWTHHTFNPWWGCTKISAGCKHCYADTFSRRLGLKIWGDDAERRFFGDKHWAEPLKWDRAAAKAGERHRVFCASMADVFEDRRDLDAHRARLWALIDATPHLDWLLLTKRPDVMLRLWPFHDRVRPNVWAGTTVEDQHAAEERVPALCRVPALLRFLSVEPLIDSIDLDLPRCDTHGREFVVSGEDGESCGECAAGGWSGEMPHGCWLDPLNDGIGWVIVGGESGAGARACLVPWVRSVVEQCASAQVPCFVKQLGAQPIAADEDDIHPTVIQAHDAAHGWPPPSFPWRVPLRSHKGGDIDEFPKDLRVRQFPAVEP